MNNKYCIDEITFALFCLTVICLCAVFYSVEGVKDLLLTTAGGIIGFLTKTATEKRPPATPSGEQPKT